MGRTNEEVEEFLDDVDFSNQDVEAIKDELLSEADEGEDLEHDVSDCDDSN